jgi:hypothetical protein|tara:strand:- start:168 stop:455 length:288 start_codon:yes stop_codon:yes gene_type:complete
MIEIERNVPLRRVNSGKKRVLNQEGIQALSAMQVGDSFLAPEEWIRSHKDKLARGRIKTRIHLCSAIYDYFKSEDKKISTRTVGKNEGVRVWRVR